MKRGSIPNLSTLRQQESKKLVKICLVTANNSYRILVDLLYRMSVKRIELADTKQSVSLCQQYQ